VRSVSTIATTLIGAGLIATRASAAHPLPLEYSAPPSCLDRPSFLKEVEQRLPRSTVNVRSLRVAIEPASREFVARLVIADAGGAVAEREINGATCKEVASAMAVVVALVLTELSGQGASLPAPRPAPAPSDRPPAPPAAPSDARAPAAPPADPDRIDSQATPGIRFGAGLLGTATGGMSPGVAWGGLGYFELGGLERPALRLGLGARATRSFESGPGAARFEWFGGKLDGCWPLTSIGANAWLAGCAMVEAGALRAHGSGVDTANSTVDPWLALGVLLRPAFRTGSVIFQADFGPTFPLLDRTFVFRTGPESEAVVHELPRVSWQLGVGAGLEL
jgi:hypothetical protein